MSPAKFRPLAVVCISAALLSPSYSKDGEYFKIDYGIGLDAESPKTTRGEKVRSGLNQDVSLVDISPDNEHQLTSIGWAVRYGNWDTSLRLEQGSLEAGNISYENCLSGQIEDGEPPVSAENCVVYPFGSDEASIDIVGQSSMDADTGSVMLEVTHLVPINEKVEFWAMFGVGITRIKTTNIDSQVVFHPGDDGTYFTTDDDSYTARFACGISTSNRSNRFGFGGQYSITDKVSLNFGYTSTVYGTALFKSVEGYDWEDADTNNSLNGTCAESKSALTVEDILTGELRIGFSARY